MLSDTIITIVGVIIIIIIIVVIIVNKALDLEVLDSP